MQIQPLFDDVNMPALIEPQNSAEASLVMLNGWLVSNATVVSELLLSHGALLLRGFEVTSAEGFSAVAKAVTGELKPYLGGDSPRSAILEKVYTSTDFPAHMEITLHNELCYTGEWPSRVLFWCKQSPQSGGQTQIGDAREIYNRIDADVRQRFSSKGVLYVRNYHHNGGAGKPWQETFETNSREDVEAYCARSGMSCEWFDWGLRTLIKRPGVITHPVTGETAWFNQADQFHATFNTPWKDAFDADAFDESELPFHVYYGDGSPISVDDLEERRRVQKDGEILFDWQNGDVMILDNILTMHGRKPFTGEREILVAMG